MSLRGDRDMRETFRAATLRKRRDGFGVPMVRVSRPATQEYLSREMPDIFDARRMLRRLVRAMVRAGWSMSACYCVSWDGGSTITAQMTRDGDVCRVAVDGSGCWRGVGGQTAAQFVGGVS